MALWQAWGLLEQRLGRPDSARALYQQGLEPLPYNRFLLLAYGQLEKEAGNITQARSLLKFGVKHNPLDAALVQVSDCKYNSRLASGSPKQRSAALLQSRTCDRRSQKSCLCLFMTSGDLSALCLVFEGSDLLSQMQVSLKHKLC